MKNLKLFSLIGICFMFLLSCKNEDEPKGGNNVILNYDGLGESVIEGSITPISVTINLGHEHREVCFSENRDSLEMLMKDYDNLWDYINSSTPRRINYKSVDSCYESLMVTFYDLKPSTQYYYFVTEHGWNSRKFSPIRTFKTEDVNLWVDLGGSVKWCGVNYLENRGEFNISQFLLSTLYGQSELPKADKEEIEGNWRYPSIEELQELCDNCSITMVDFEKMFVKLTSNNGNSLYIPFTLHCPLESKSYGLKELMLFPSNQNEYGLYIQTIEMWPLENEWDFKKYGYHVIFKNRPYDIESQTQDYKLKICTPTYNGTDFFRWSYIDGTVTPEKEIKGTEKRGIRFVLEK